jgi:hypothetical protein
MCSLLQLQTSGGAASVTCRLLDKVTRHYAEASVHPDAPGPGTVSPLVVPGIVALPAEIDIGNAVRVGDELGAALGSRGHCDS